MEYNFIMTYSSLSRMMSVSVWILSIPFRFTATYYNHELGYFVEAYNGVYANTVDKGTWQILDGSMKPTKLGKSARFART